VFLVPVAVSIGFLFTPPDAVRVAAATRGWAVDLVKLFFLVPFSLFYFSAKRLAGADRLSKGDAVLIVYAGLGVVFAERVRLMLGETSTAKEACA
jgi:hypothetical protein